MKKLWRVTEPDAVAEFLKNEFYRDEFHRDRENFEHVVMHADIANEAENALRRALLFRRRGHMWRELPADTQWWEVSIEPSDLELLRVFPRAQWRRIASGSFLLEKIAERIRDKKFSGRTREFISKVQALSYRLRTDQTRSCVLLIGIDESSPFWRVIIASPPPCWRMERSFRTDSGCCAVFPPGCPSRAGTKRMWLIYGGMPRIECETWCTTKTPTQSAP